jgi:hypothetical protein
MAGEMKSATALLYRGGPGQQSDSGGTARTAHLSTFVEPAHRDGAQLREERYVSRRVRIEIGWKFR